MVVAEDVDPAPPSTWVLPRRRSSRARSGTPLAPSVTLSPARSMIQPFGALIRPCGIGPRRVLGRRGRLAVLRRGRSRTARSGSGPRPVPRCRSVSAGCRRRVAGCRSESGVAAGASVALARRTFSGPLVSVRKMLSSASAPTRPTTGIAGVDLQVVAGRVGVRGRSPMLPPFASRSMLLARMFAG